MKIENVTIAPNGFLSAYSTDTYLVDGNVNFGDIDNGQDVITGLYRHDDNLFANPIKLTLAGTTKKVLVRVFSPDGLPPVKFVAHANFEGVLYGNPSANPRLFLLDGDEIEIYGLPEIKKIRLMPDNINTQPFLVSISLFN